MNIFKFAMRLLLISSRREHDGCRVQVREVVTAKKKRPERNKHEVITQKLLQSIVKHFITAHTWFFSLHKRRVLLTCRRLTVYQTLVRHP